MTVDEVREWRARIFAEEHPATGARLDRLRDLDRAVVHEIASMKAEYPGDAIIMRALARAAIGADDETS